MSEESARTAVPRNAEASTRRTRREVAAEATERAIVDAAYALFRSRGYHATSMEDLAVEAGVAVQTIYNSIGSKRAVLSRVIDVTAAGPEAPTRVPVFMEQRVASARTTRQVVDVLASWFAEAQPRTVEMWEMVTQAAALDPTIAKLEFERADQRFRNYHRASASIEALGGLAAIDEPEAAAAIWALAHPLVYRFLVRGQGWSDARYRAWLTTMLGRIVGVPEESPPAASSDT